MYLFLTKPSYMILRKVFIFISIIIFITTSQAQEEFQEQIDKLDFKTIYSRFETYYNDLDSINALRYAEAYYTKAKKIKDTNRITEGYYYRALVDKRDRVDLYDSIINLKPSKKWIDQSNTAYLQKAYYYFQKRQYDKALNNYIEARNHNKNENRETLEFDINLSIAELQIRIEENEKALKILEKLWQKAITLDYKNKDVSTYNRTLFNLANANRKLNYIDTSYAFIKLGIQANDNDQKESNYYYYFLLLEGILALSSSSDIQSNEKIQEVMDYMNRIGYKENISLAYHYIGKAYLKNGNEDKALNYFLKVDSLTNNPITISPEIVGSYKYIRAYYSKKNDAKNELIYLKKIITFDSILNTNYKSINNKIKDKYELPILLEDYNQKLITLNNKNKKSNTKVVALYVISSSILIILFFFIFQRNTYKKRFKKLQESGNIKKKTQNYIPNEKPNLPEEIFTKVKDCLERFEKEEQFLNPSINSEKLAKQIGTNRPYFSKVFSYYKNESFNIYLRNLRLDYALERLRNDHTFRKYTIKAIALESGFSNTESFSKFFYKKFGIYPSYYIKSLKNIDN